MSTGIISDYFGKRIYLLFSFIASLPIFIATNSFAKNARINENQFLAFFACLLFVAAIFYGRYLAQIYMTRKNTVSRRTFILLALAITACMSWLFFYSEFPLEDRQSMSILLFFLPFFILFLLFGILIKIIRTIAENQLIEARSSAAQSKSELNLLQSQLSPHFLFNTLNNLYGLSLSETQRLPPLLLKLSELLRYSVYQATEPFVPLNDEIEYIKNYIEFEKLRIGDKLVLSTQIEENEFSNVRIAPMLLIIFVENAFKHSKNTANDKIYIDISLKTWENFILFTIKNSHSRSANANNNVNKHSGYGMDNVRKRLELLYTNDHILEIKNEEDQYKVMLQLKMK